MKCTSYYREDETITYDNYRGMKKRVLKEFPKYKWEMMNVRKLRFMETGCEVSTSNLAYDISMKNEDTQQIYLEKRICEYGRYYKSCTHITKEQVEQIINGDIEWMKNHKDAILADFYRQISLNNLQPGFMTDYVREIINTGKKGYIIFNKEITREASNHPEFFGKIQCPIRCVGSGEVHYEYKQIASIPVVLSHMFQQQEEIYEQVALCM